MARSKCSPDINSIEALSPDSVLRAFQARQSTYGGVTQSCAPSADICRVIQGDCRDSPKNIRAFFAGVSSQGNTAGSTGTNSIGLVLVGGTNITLSQSTNAFGNTVTILGGAGGASGLAISAGTQSVSTGTLVFSNSNGITFGMSGSSRVTASYTVPSVVKVSLSGNTVGALGLISTGTMILAGGNNITLSQNGNSVTISGPSVGAPGSISAGTTSAALGQVVFSNSNSVSFGMNGATVTASVSFPAQTVQTQNAVNLSLSGNTSGALALISSGTAILAGGNNITLSQNGQSVTISAASQTVQTQNNVDVTLSGNTSGALALISSGTMTLAGGSNITLSQAGNAITIIGASGGAGGVGISAGTQSVSTGTVVFSNSNGVTFGMSGSSRVTASVATFGIGVSNLGNQAGSTGTISMAPGQVVFVGSNNITLIQTQVGNSLTITVFGTPQTNQTLGLFMSSNTTSSISSGTVDARSMTFRGAGVVSVGYSAGEVVISAPAAAGDGVNIIAAGTQTANTTGTVVFSNSNNVSFGMSNSSIVTASFSQSVQTQNNVDVSLSGNTSGALALVSSGTLTLAGGNNITLSQAGNAVTISGPTTAAETPFGVSAGTQSVSTGTLVFSNSNGISFGMSGSSRVTASYTVPAVVDLSLSGNTSGTLTLISSGTAILAGGNNITLSQNGQSITISAFNQTVQTQNNVDVTLSGNTSGALALISSGTMTLAGGNNITLSQAGNAVTISAGNAGGGAGISAGTQSVSTGTVVFSNSNNVSFGMSNSSVVTASFSQSVQTQNVVDVSLSGNTSGVLALVSSGTLILAGGNNVTLSQNGQSITISAGGAGTGGATMLAGVSSFGETFGSTGTVSNMLILVGSNGIGLSQSTGGASSATVTIMPSPYLSQWEPAPYINATVVNEFGAGTMLMWPVNVSWPVTASRANHLVSVGINTAANNTTNAYAVSLSIGIYTGNSTSLSLMSSGSQSYRVTNSSNNSTSLLNGWRNLSVPININLTPGQYVLALHSSTASSNGQSFSLSNVYLSATSARMNGVFGVEASNSTRQIIPWFGRYSNNTFSSAMPATIDITAVNGLPNFIPYVNFVNVTA